MATRYAVAELESVDSTQDEARERFADSDPVLVIAGHQTAGRGRLGREWLEPDRAVFASLAFEPVWPIEAWSLIPLAAGLAARSTIGAVAGVTVGLRWPNDLVVDAGKIGGLLAESGDGIVIVGFGLNLLWEDPIQGGAALCETVPAPRTEREIAERWADRLLASMALPSDDWGIDEYRAACVTIGRSVSYASGSGTAVAVSDKGSLMVETTGGIIAVHSGEVRLDGRTTLSTDPRRN
ncbi:MAG: biotin--[acetyl-CoA-carboxylase] ligase [Actinomycetota bacterium]|nr:biotin--[acetyl-CoA-carboxylase] ligase [Actinomycetota bacterium]